ncbi:MAG TPA: fumarylacetoacetate hydrolase family protein [Pyrinomonadaceae bacterium]|nr:fumarylacetoacetate hydrolase family protein [Pyrinomonadaceae bacterium]
MKLVSFQHEGKTSYGAVAGDRLVDLGGRYPTLQAAIEGGALAVLAAGDGAAGPTLAEIEFLPVVARPEKIICVGVNYHDHRIETGRTESEYPVLFTRFANTLAGHGRAIIRPRASTQLDYEGELAVVIGRRARHIKPADALSYVAGYSCFNDATLRDWQRHTHQFTPGKNFPATGALGPWLVTADEIPDPSQLTLVTRLNGEEMQRTTTREMIFDIPTLVAYISTFTELVPGDVIATGTPGGVGAKRTPPVWMKAGDEIEVEISGVGILRNRVADEN